MVLGTLDDGAPAIVANHFGQGEAILIGSFLGLGTHPTLNENDRTFIRNLTHWAGIEPAMMMDPPSPVGLEAVLRRTPSSSLLFLLNPLKESREAKLALKATRDGRFEARELLKGETAAYTAAQGRLELAQKLDAESVAIWETRGLSP